MNLLNLIWPAIYVAAGLKQLWFCILITVFLEWLIIQLVLKPGWLKSGLMSLVGNAVSGVAGIYIMPYVMMLYHFLADRWTGGTFTLINGFATLIIMCIGSVLIEVIVVRMIWKIPIRKLLLPMLTGNLITYILLVYLWYNHIIVIEV